LIHNLNAAVDSGFGASDLGYTRDQHLMMAHRQQPMCRAGPE